MKASSELISLEEAFAPRLAITEKPGYEIWFAVFIDPRQQHGLWLRYTHMRDEANRIQRFVWASFFDNAAPNRHAFGVEGQSSVKIDELRLEYGKCSLGPHDIKGQVKTPAGNLSWDLKLQHRFAPHAHGPGGAVGRLASRVSEVQSTVLSPFALASGEIRLGKHHSKHDRMHATFTHIIGTRRVDRLHWLWAPAFQGDDSFGAEAVTVKPRPGMPAITFATIRKDGQLFHGKSITGGRHKYPSLRFKVRCGPHRLKAKGTLNLDNKTGYIYRDLDRSARFIVQSDVSNVECVIKGQGSIARLASAASSAIEFHGSKPWPGVMYLDPFATDD